MDMKKEIVELFRRAAKQVISESEFWELLKKLDIASLGPLGNIAYEAAIHFWGNFHERNVLFIKTKPLPYALEQDRDALKVIADAIEADWPVSELERKLKDI
jgi:hypothetical protein